MGELQGETGRVHGAPAETRVVDEIMRTAASQHAINPAQVAHLMKDRFQADMTVADAVRAFLEDNPHLVRRISRRDAETQRRTPNGGAE